MNLDLITRHKMLFAVLLASGVVIVAFQVAAYYYYPKLANYCPSPCLGSKLTVDTLINYGNGTSVWINETEVPSDWNFYQLTDSIAKVQATYYGPPTSEHFITAINGIQSNRHNFWSLWTVCEKSNSWMASSVGADAIHITAYHTFAWYYQAETSQDSSTWNPPVNGAPKVTTC